MLPRDEMITQPVSDFYGRISYGEVGQVAFLAECLWYLVGYPVCQKLSLLVHSGAYRRRFHNRLGFYDHGKQIVGLYFQVCRQNNHGDFIAYLYSVVSLSNCCIPFPVLLGVVAAQMNFAFGRIFWLFQRTWGMRRRILFWIVPSVHSIIEMYHIKWILMHERRYLIE